MTLLPVPEPPLIITVFFCPSPICSDSSLTLHIRLWSLIIKNSLLPSNIEPICSPSDLEGFILPLSIRYKISFSPFFYILLIKLESFTESSLKKMEPYLNILYKRV